MMMAFSCVLDEIDSQPAVEPRLECDALESYTIQAQKPQDIAFTVSSTTPWKITGFESAPWIKVTPSSSDESSLAEDIIISSSANNSMDDRSVTLTLSGDNTNIKYSIVVKQMRKGSLTVTPIAQTDAFATGGSSKTFKVESNISWEAYAAEEWLKLSPSSGTSEGPMKTFDVTATADANSSIVRTCLVTVAAGDDKYEFTVQQNGQTLEFLPVDNTAIDRTGGEITIGVDASMDWKVECDNADFTVTKDGDKVKVSAPWNNRFAERKGTVTIKPVTADYGDVSSSVEVSQGVNFELSGGCEVLSDGSVKLTKGGTSRVSTKDTYRYASITLTMGDVSFGDKGQLCLSTHDAMIPDGAPKFELQCQIKLGSKVRLRTNGGKDSGYDTYNTKDIPITKDDLNSLKTYKVDFKPAGAGEVGLEFFYNGTSKASMTSPSAFEYDPAVVCHYFFGFEDSPSDDTWYVVKSCDITPVNE